MKTDIIDDLLDIAADYAIEAVRLASARQFLRSRDGVCEDILTALDMVIQMVIIHANDQVLKKAESLGTDIPIEEINAAVPHVMKLHAVGPHNELAPLIMANGMNLKFVEQVNAWDRMTDVVEMHYSEVAC